MTRWSRPTGVVHSPRRGRTRRQDYYQDRHNELAKQKLLPAAGALAGAFEAYEVVHEEVLLRALSRELGLDETAAARRV